MDAMSENLLILCGTAAAIGAGHTLLGPDHYIPFVAMAKAGRWSTKRTIVITLLCGVGHVVGSAVLGLVGIAIGVGVFHLERIESVRGDIAGWLLLAFGLAYAIWGLRRAARNRPHAHVHAHADGTVHVHEHVHASEHVHVHSKANAHDRASDRSGDANAVSHDGSSPSPTRTPSTSPSLTPWILFTIFIFGPCEPLIPLVMYPAARGNLFAAVWVTTVFGLVTLATMTSMVLLMRWGVGFVRMATLERYTHALAGAAITMCGVAVTFFGL